MSEPSPPVNRTSPTSPSGRRRTAADMASLKRQIIETVAENEPLTVRELFYLLVSRGAVEKTEREYKGTVDRLLTELRRAGSIPYSAISDHTRWIRRPRTYSSPEEALRQTAKTYRRALWDDAPARVELWCEKDALAGVLVEETGPYDVPLMVTRGYASLTYLHMCAEDTREAGKPTYVYYVGDLDPSGVDAERFVREELTERLGDVPLFFERIAVTREQVRRNGIPTRPTKRTDSRARGFEGESVEVDAIPPRELRAMVKVAIENHIDSKRLRHLLYAEKKERAVMDQLVRSFSGGSA